MSKLLLQLTLLVPVAVGLAILVAVSGCTDPAATGALQIETVHEIFPSATDISKISISRDAQTSGRSGNSEISEIRDSSGLLGYSVESEVVSRSGPFKIAMVLDKQLVVKRATVVSYPWQRGRKVARRAFTSQFEGKGPEDPIEIGNDVDAMTGATISCSAMAEGIREALKLMEASRQDSSS